MSARSPLSRVIDEVIRSGPSELLKSHGYKKQARSFSWHGDGLYRVVQFQASQWNHADEARFTINLNVVVPAYHEAVIGTPFPKNAASAGAVVQDRIGRHMPEHNDKWWSITTATDVTKLGAEIREAIARFGLPFLSEFSSAADLLRLYEARKTLPGMAGAHQLCHAVLLALTGRRDEAGEHFRELVAKNDHQGFRQKVERIAGRVGVGETAVR